MLFGLFTRKYGAELYLHSKTKTNKQNIANTLIKPTLFKTKANKQTKIKSTLMYFLIIENLLKRQQPLCNRLNKIKISEINQLFVCLSKHK